MTISWKGVVWAGLLAGLGSMSLQILLGALVMDGGPWLQLRLLATMLLGHEAAPPPSGFDLAAVSAGVLAHFALSILVALVLGILITATGADLVWSVIGGAIFGLLVYLVGYYGFTAAFPALHEARSGATLFNHLLYGAVLAGLYRAISAPVEVPPVE